MYRYETLYITQIDHPETNTHQSALHIWVILLKSGRYCDMEKRGTSHLLIVFVRLRSTRALV